LNETEPPLITGVGRFGPSAQQCREFVVQPLRAGVAAKGSQRDKIEHLARYVSRPPIATERLALTESGKVSYALKTPYRDGTTHVIFEPEDFIARLAALVPKPRAHPKPTERGKPACVSAVSSSSC
jgi:hypothetical protein